MRPEQKGQNGHVPQLAITSCACPKKNIKDVYHTIKNNLKSADHRFHYWLCRKVLDYCFKHNNKKSGTLAHAIREFAMAGYPPIINCKDDPDKWIQENVLDLIKLFAMHGHSGSSASYTINVYKKLATYEPLSPITGKPEEWRNVAKLCGQNEGELFQNIRCPSIFKKNGQAYYLDAIIWENENGVTYTGSALTSENVKYCSRQNITFPFTPKSFVVGVTEREDGEGQYDSIINDISQLTEALDYFSGKTKGE